MDGNQYKIFLMGWFRLCATAVLTALCASSAFATEEIKDPYEGNLLNNWGGQRGVLADAGVDVTVEYKADFWDVAEGGIKTGRNFDDNLDVKFALDGEKLFGIKGNKAMIYFINNDGSHPNLSRLGSLQGIDNIEVVKDTPKLYEAWMDQSFFDGKLSLLAGLRDLNAEFVETDSTANFIKPVMQIGPEFALSGRGGPSIFPTTSLAARVKLAPTEETYMQGGVFNAVAGDPDHPYGNHIETGGGALLIAEAGYVPAGQGDANLTKFALGAWEYTQKFDDQFAVDASGNPLKKRSDGAYALASYRFYHEQNSHRDMTAFFRPGIADGDTRPIDIAYEAGLVGHGWVAARPDSEIGLGVSQSHNADTYVRAMALVSTKIDRNEYGAELYYRDEVYHGVSLQPDVQYAANPATDARIDNSWIVGLRADVNF